jgi:hypothetical protein
LLTFFIGAKESGRECSFPHGGTFPIFAATNGLDSSDRMTEWCGIDFVHHVNGFTRSRLPGSAGLYLRQIPFAIFQNGSSLSKMLHIGPGLWRLPLNTEGFGSETNNPRDFRRAGGGFEIQKLTVEFILWRARC